MKYDCTITDISDDEITIKIDEVYLVGFDHFGILKNVGDKAVVDITLFDDLHISPSKSDKPAIIKNSVFSYSLIGILDIDNLLLKSKINFEIDKEELFDYGYLDGQMVEIKVLRMDFDFV
ncbi:MAG: hypothetical protein K2K01_07175 [Eubacterium sp.]|nr:hypothetical protein [Eubacterium sp.]